MVTESSEIGKFLVSWTARRPHVCEILVQLLLSHLCIYKKFGAWPRLRPGQGYTREPAWILRNAVAPLQLREYISQIWGKACKIVSAWLQISLHQCHLKTSPTFTLSPTFNPISGSLLPLILKPLRDRWSLLMKDFATCKMISTISGEEEVFLRFVTLPFTPRASASRGRNFSTPWTPTPPSRGGCLSLPPGSSLLF